MTSKIKTIPEHSRDKFGGKPKNENSHISRSSEIFHFCLSDSPNGMNGLFHLFSLVVTTANDEK